MKPPQAACQRTPRIEIENTIKLHAKERHRVIYKATIYIPENDAVIEKKTQFDDNS